jgi:hypothetical protein
MASADVLAQTLQCADISGQAEVQNVRFDQDVMPILELDELNCTTCHGSAAGLSIDQGNASHGNLYCQDTQGTSPLDPGKLVVPGAPMESWLYLRVACDDLDDQSFRMPRFSDTTLFTSELRIIYDWIAQGAPSADTIFTSRFDERGYCS